MSTGVGGLPGGEGGSLKRTLRDQRSYVQHLKIRGRIIKDALTSLFDPLRSRFLKMFEKGTVKSFNCGNMLPNLPQENPSPEQGQTPCKGD